MDEVYEELSIAEFEGEAFNQFKINKENKYAFAHHIYNKGPFSPSIVEIGLSYQELVGYLKGATLGKKPNKEIFVYNGISSVARNGFFPGAEFYSLSGKDLEELLLVTKLDRKFENKIRRV